MRWPAMCRFRRKNWEIAHNLPVFRGEFLGGFSAAMGPGRAGPGAGRFGGVHGGPGGRELWGGPRGPGALGGPTGAPGAGSFGGIHGGPLGALGVLGAE